MLEFSDFITMFCVGCGHCARGYLYRQERTFCFEFYEQDQSKFIRHCYYELKKDRDWPVSEKTEEKMFSNIFCKSGICTSDNVHSDIVGKKCRHYVECLSDFIDTSMHTMSPSSKYRYLSQSKTVDKIFHVNKAVKKIEPIVLYGGCKEWKEIIEQLV